MITLIEKGKLGRTIKTNDIPRNTTFYGRIVRDNGEISNRGLFLCIGSFSNSGTGPFTVSLTPRGGEGKFSNAHYVSTHCTDVFEYEPVDIEIRVI